MFAITGQPDLPKPLDNMTNYREVHGDPISEDCMGRVKEMIQLCDQCHPQCRSSVTTSLPRRVINVGTSDCDPRLYISQGEAANYIALSHCWAQLGQRQQPHQCHHRVRDSCGEVTGNYSTQNISMLSWRLSKVQSSRCSLQLSTP